MMKSYLRYEPEKTFGVIASPQCNIAYDFSGNLAITGALQGINIWNIRQATQLANIQVENPGYPYTATGEARVIMRCDDKNSVAVGYSKGEVRIFDYFSKSIVSTLRGHRTSVSSLAYGTNKLLASGSADCDIIIWDLVSFTGICKLRGHKDMVTGLAFLNSIPGSSQQFLVSVSKDTLLKVWDFSTSHCVQTIVGHRCEIWSVVSQNTEDGDVRVLTGGGDDLIRGYRLKKTTTPPTKLGEISDPSTAITHEGLEGESGIVSGGVVLGDEEAVLEYYGCIQRSVSGSDHCSSLSICPSGSLLASASTGRNVEIFKLRSANEAKKKFKRRMKRIREKVENPSTSLTASATNETLTEDGWLISSSIPTSSSSSIPSNSSSHDLTLNPNQILLSDEIEPHSLIVAPQKVRGFVFSPLLSRDGSCKALLSTVENLLEVYQFPASIVSGTRNSSSEPEAMKPTKVSIIELHGHRSDVRAVCLSSDGLYSATCSSDGVKIWSSKSNTCVRSCNTGFGTALSFTHGSRYTVSGTKEGGIQVLDTISGLITANIPPSSPSSEASSSSPSGGGEGHSGAVWALDVRPDGKGFMTGSADRTIKFWDFIITEGALGVKLTRQLQMTHDVLCLRYNQTKSQDRLMLAAGLLDNTIKIFYDDSLRFFLSLYGHKLPVMCLDMSYDSTLLVSGSADKTIKIWGLDFGDCHRSLHAHEDSVTCLRFQPDTHYFFSGGKDGAIKYWDADRFEQVLFLPGHVGSVWGLCVAFDGSFLLSAGQDRSLRVWARTDDLVFVEEEKERALEAEVERTAARFDDPNGPTGEQILGAPTSATGAIASAQVSIPSAESVKGGELLMDAIDLVEKELAEMQSKQETIDTRKALQQQQQETEGNHEMKKLKQVDASAVDERKWSSSNPLMLGLTPQLYLIRSLRQIKAPDMEQALLVMPFHYISRFIPLLLQLISRGLEIELCVRCILLLMRVHFPQIVSTHALLPYMQTLNSIVMSSSGQYRSLLGTNLAGLKYLTKSLESKRITKIGFGNLEEKLNNTYFGGMGTINLHNSSTTTENVKKNKKRQHSS